MHARFSENIIRYNGEPDFQLRIQQKTVRRQGSVRTRWGRTRSHGLDLFWGRRQPVEKKGQKRWKERNRKREKMKDGKRGRTESGKVKGSSPAFLFSTSSPLCNTIYYHFISCSQQSDSKSRFNIIFLNCNFLLKSV